MRAETKVTLGERKHESGGILHQKHTSTVLLLVEPSASFVSLLQVSRMWGRSWGVWMSREGRSDLISSYFHNDMWWFYPRGSLELCSELCVAHVILTAEMWAIAHICEHAHTHTACFMILVRTLCSFPPHPPYMVTPPTTLQVYFDRHYFAVYFQNNISAFFWIT